MGMRSEEDGGLQNEYRSHGLESQLTIGVYFS